MPAHQQPGAPCPLEGKLKGVFSSPGLPGETPPPDAPKRFWFVKPAEKGTVMVQLLDANLLPTSKRMVLPRADFLKGFTPEPDQTYHLLTTRVLQGDSYREQGLSVEAKIEYLQALRVDEENIRATFGLGLAYLALNQLEKGRYALEKLAALDESFSPEHKHLFNEFGIALRKKGLYDEAIRFYERARLLSPDDENLLLNLARAWYEKGEREPSFEHLKGCLERNGSFREALAFLAYLRKREIHPQDATLRAWFDHFALKRSELGRLLGEG